VLTGKINDVGAYTRTNIDQSYRLGLEMQGGWRPCNWASLNGNLTLSSNKAIGFVEYYDDYDQGGQISVAHGNTTLALSPAVTQFASLNLTPFKNADIVLSQKYVSRQFLDNTSNVARSLNPYNVFDLKFNYVLKGKLVEEANFLLQLNNVFNKKYEPNGYTYSYKYGGVVVTENFYFPMAERNYMVGVNLRF
jgi:iron complex outermembrane receptor protein